jgi:hypothetical protein
LHRLAELLGATPTDLELATNLGFFFRNTQERFFGGRPQTVNEVRTMILDLSAWLRRILRDHESVSLLGL